MTLWLLRKLKYGNIHNTIYSGVKKGKIIRKNRTGKCYNNLGKARSEKKII